MSTNGNDGNTVTVTDDNFLAEIAEHGGLSMVDFGAEWCGPCRFMDPVVRQLADEYAGRVRVGKVDVDANPRIAAQFNVRSLPTVHFFRDGAIVDSVVGAVPKPVLERKIQQHL